MKHYMIVSPEYEIYSGSCDPPEPPQYACDVVSVDANTSHDALVIGFRLLRRQRGRTWLSWYNDECPFGKFKVILL